MRIFSFIVEGRIPAKKSRHRVRTRKARLALGKKGKLEYKRAAHFIAPDADYQEWENRAALVIKVQKNKTDIGMIEKDIIFQAVIFRKGARRLDLSNSIQGLEDAAQKAGIIKNDNQIRNHGDSMQIFNQDFDGALVEIYEYEFPETFIKIVKARYHLTKDRYFYKEK